MPWDISLLWHHKYVGGTEYTATGGYSRAPFAYSDRVGDPSEDIAVSAGFPAADFTYDSQRVWDNRPFARPDGVTPSFPRSSNYVDPALGEWVGQTGWAGSAVDVNSDHGDYFPVNWIQIYWGDTTESSTVGVKTSKAVLFDVRVNGIAEGDYFSATDLVRDIANRLGIDDTQVGHHGVNILPYDLKTGNWGDALDHAALMTGWIWRILGTGARRTLEFFPWGDADHWVVDDDRVPRNLKHRQRYDAISVPYHYPGDNGGVEATVHVRRPEKTPDGTQDYGVVAMDSLPSRDKAEYLAHQLLHQLHKHGTTGDMTIAGVTTRAGLRDSGYLVHAGDKIDFTPTRKRNLRVQSVRKTYEGTDVTFEETNAMVDSIIARANRSLVNKN